VAQTSASRFTERNRIKIIEIGVVTNCVRNNSAIEVLVKAEERLL
jgi:hypothetical protein